MLVYGSVRTWNSGALDEADRQLRTLTDRLLGLGDELTVSAAPKGWHGRAADLAGDFHAQIADRMEHLVAEISATRGALQLAADRIIDLRHLVSEAESLARANRFALDDNGGVVDHGVSPDVPEDQVEDVTRERAKIRAELSDRVAQILRIASDIDTTCADVLDRAARGEIGDGGATTLADAAENGFAAEPEIPGRPEFPHTDEGAGEHGSDPWYTTGDDLVVHDLADAAAKFADAYGWTHAAEQMRKIATDAEENGTYGKPVPFTSKWYGHYVSGAESKDWYYAMGGFRYSLTGVATVHPPAEPGGQPEIEVDYRTHVYDRYNWDHGKQTQIGPVTISDDQMQELHRAGVAQEFDIAGSSGAQHYSGKTPGEWDAPDLPTGDAGRDGQRGDPARQR
ncbi:hypothetical protein GCM10027445_44360 [Amycolatopsis endophytica]